MKRRSRIKIIPVHKQGCISLQKRTIGQYWIAIVNENPGRYQFRILSQAYQESKQTCKIERFEKIVDSLKALAIFANDFILDVWLGSGYGGFWLMS